MEKDNAPSINSAEEERMREYSAILKKYGLALPRTGKVDSKLSVRSMEKTKYPSQR